MMPRSIFKDKVIRNDQRNGPVPVILSQETTVKKPFSSLTPELYSHFLKMPDRLRINKHLEMSYQCLFFSL